MSIVVQCPHCETRFNLQPEMNGKSMRCPNLECRQVFTARAQEDTAPPPVLELPPEPPPAPRPTKPGKPPKPKVVEAEVVDAAVVEAAVVSPPKSPPKVKEVVWTEGADVPPPKKPRKPVQAEAAEDDDLLPVRRKRKKNRGPIILLAMAVLSVALAGFGLLYYLRFQDLNEQNLAKQAETEYSEGRYADAGRSYEKLAGEYPSSKDIDKYKFFAELSAMQGVVRSVTNREDYDAAVKRLKAFIDAQKDSPFARPTSGYGRDILEAGKKLGEDVGHHAEDRVKAFQADRSKSGELERAEKAVAVGRELIPLLDPYRAADDPPLDSLKALFDNAEKGVKRERDRTAAIARARAQLEAPTDALIQTVEGDLAAAGFLEDPEAQSLIAAAKGKLRDLVRYEDDPAASQAPPPTAAASLLFVTPLGKTKLAERAAADPPAVVFLCVARGILYALDEDSGALLWATRVGPDVTDAPAVARVTLAAGPTDIAVVASNVGNAPAVAAHVLKSGEVKWYQPLPAPAAGPAVVVGGRAFVPLRDALGTVYEFDLVAGTRVGRIRVGQPVGPAAVLRPGTNLLYVAADARRIYIIDAGGTDDVGSRVNPRCLQVMATGHPAGTLRVPPLFVGPDGTDPAERWMVLSQSDGSLGMKLRAFAVGPIAPAGDGETVPETPAAPAVALPVPGWVHFPPVSDGERLAVVSDTGQFRLFGVNQTGNSDKALFPLPSQTLPAPADGSPTPGLVIPVAESTYWLLASGQLQKARLALDRGKGQEIVLAGSPLAVGAPTQPAQTNARKDVACVVVRSPNSSGCRAIAFDLRDGEVRWQRQLGLVPAAAPFPQGESLILVDEDGGLVAVPTANRLAPGQTLAAPPEWLLASAPPNPTGPTAVAVSADGKLAYAVTPVSRDGPKFAVRRIADGKVTHQDEVVAPAALAGRPAVVGDRLLIPTADGFVNRLVPGAGLANPAKLEAGPPWQGERRSAGASCTITPLSDSSFATSDGGKRLSRWNWPSAGAWNPADAWELRGPVAGPGVVLPPGEPDGPPRLLVADASGSVWLFRADRTGQPLRRWQPGRVIPEGRPSSPFAVQATDPAKLSVAYVVDGQSAAALNPEREEALWAARTGEDASSRIVGAPQSAGDNRWVLTDLAGRVVVLDGASGEVLATRTVGLPGAVPAVASGVAANSALTPLSDGSAVVIDLPKSEPKPEEKEEKKGKE